MDGNSVYSNGDVLTMNGGVAEWQTPSTGTNFWDTLSGTLFDTSYNVGIGTDTALTDLQIGPALHLQDEAGFSLIGHNMYFNGTQFVYTNDGEASIEGMQGGLWQLTTFASGTAGSVGTTANSTGQMTFENGRLAINDDVPSDATLEIYPVIDTIALLIDHNYQAGTTSTGLVRMMDTANNYVEFHTPEVVNTSYRLTLPSDPPNNGDQLISNGTGDLSWQAPSSGSYSPWDTTTTFTPNRVYHDTKSVFVGDSTSLSGLGGVLNAITTDSIGLLTEQAGITTSAESYGVFALNSLSGGSGHTGVGVLGLSQGTNDVNIGIQAAVQNADDNIGFDALLTAGNDRNYGGRLEVSGADTNYGLYIDVNNNLLGDSAIGLYSTATGPGNPISAYFDQGRVYMNESLKIGGGATISPRTLDIVGDAFIDSVWTDSLTIGNYGVSGAAGNPGDVLTLIGTGNVATWVAPTSATPQDSTRIWDGDGDTYIQVDSSSSDVDDIRMAIDGVEVFRVDASETYFLNRSTADTALMFNDDQFRIRTNATPNIVVQNGYVGVTNGAQFTPSIPLDVRTQGEDTLSAYRNVSTGNTLVLGQYVHSDGQNNIGTRAVGGFANAVQADTALGYYGQSEGDDFSVGIFGTATSSSGAAYAGFFKDGAVMIEDSLILPNGASNGFILTSDASGTASWQAPTVSDTVDTICPSGYTKINDRFCIQNDSALASDWFDAVMDCESQGASLPSWSEWYIGTQDGTVTYTGSNWEWIDQASQNNASIVGGGSGASEADRRKTVAADDPDSPSNTVYHRCVYRFRD